MKNHFVLLDNLYQTGLYLCLGCNKQALQDTFDFSNEQIDELTLKHAPEALKNALDVVLYNQKETLTKVKKPKNLFYDCLKNPDKYDLFPIEDKRQEEEKLKEGKRQEEEVLEQEEEEKQTEEERRKLKRQMVQAYIEFKLEDYQDLVSEALQELQEKNSFLYTQVQKLAKKKGVTEAEAFQISPFTKNLAEEKVWADKLEGNVEF